MFKKILSSIIFILVFSVLYLLFKTLAFTSKQINYKPIEKIEIRDSAIHHLSSAIKIQTISPENPLDFDSLQFTKFSHFISHTYPLIEEILVKKTINQFSYLYRWHGTNDHLKPVVLVAHYDAIPVPEEELIKWTYPPFSGEIADGILWGRGTMDNKVSIIGILEAVEHLLSRGFKPERTIYLAFGHDKEIAGQLGAQSIVNFLKQEGVHADFVLVEGLTITRGLVPGVLTDVAQIGIAEKGFVALSLSVTLNDRNPSMSNDETAKKVITNAIARLEHNPFPVEITPPIQQFLEHAGPEMRFQDKLIFANSTLFRSEILGTYQKTSIGRTLVQTTRLPTPIKNETKDEEFSTTAHATINFNIFPSMTIEQLIEEVRTTINSENIVITLQDTYWEASSVSSTTSPSYALISKSIKEIFPNLITVPNLVIDATDGRYYEDISKNVYRFLPIRLHPDNITTVQGIDEHISVLEFEDAIRFYTQLIRTSSL